MVAPLLVAGAVYILQRLSGTFTRYVWRPTGILDALENPPPELLREHPDVFRFVNFFLRVNEGFAYRLDTKEGQIDMIADLAALGAKAHFLKLGIPLLQRLMGVGAVRVLTELGLNLPETIKTLGDLLGGNPAKFLEDLVKGFHKAQKRLEAGEPVTLQGVKTAMETADYAQKVADFVSNPSPLKIPGLLKEGFDVAIALFEFFGVLVEFIPDPTPEMRMLRERLPEGAADQVTKRWMREVMPPGVRRPTGFDTLNPEVREVLSEIAKEIAGPPIAGPPTVVGAPFQARPGISPPVAGEFPPMFLRPPGRAFASLRRPTSSISHMLKMGDGMTADVLEKMKWWLLGGGARAGGGWGGAGDGGGGEAPPGGGGGGGDGGGWKLR